MLKEIRTDLIKVSSYALKMRKSTTWVYDQIKDGKLKLVEIDGIKFIKISA